VTAIICTTLLLVVISDYMLVRKSPTWRLNRLHGVKGGLAAADAGRVFFMEESKDADVLAAVKIMNEVTDRP
jgi:hypothetical protein